MLIRNEKGHLKFDWLSFEIFIRDLLAECKNKEEVVWLEEQLNDIIDVVAEERIEELS